MADKDFVFNSDFNYQKVLANEITSLSVPISGATYTYSHGLGYIPSARVWVEGKTGKWFPASNVQLQDHFTSGADFTATYYLTTTQLIVNLYNSSGSTATVNFVARVYLDD